jgi:oxygen-dependent protoporphyrinogen oxidase
LSELTDALVAALPPRSIRLGAAAERVVSGQRKHSDPPAFRVDVSSGESLTASSVILAAPAFATARIVRDLDADLAGLCDGVRYASTATIALAFPREAVAHPLNGSGFVVPKVENAGILAASWLSSKWPHRAPEGRVLVRAFAGGARDPEALRRSDDGLVESAVAALAPLLGIRGAPIFSRVYRWERANAQHEVGHLSRMDAIDRALAGHPGLFVTGSGFRGVGIPDCVADGRATARQAADFLARADAAAASRA